MWDWVIYEDLVDGEDLGIWWTLGIKPEFEDVVDLVDVEDIMICAIFEDLEDLVDLVDVVDVVDVDIMNCVVYVF